MSVCCRRPGSVPPRGGARGGVFGRVGQLLADQAGTVGMMFGLLVIPIAATVGLAVDFGRVYAVNNHTQAALDAAALAAGRVSQLEKVDTVN